MSLTSPLGRVLGLGSAKEGSRHWYAQRLSSIAVALLGAWFLVALARLGGTDLDSLRNWLRAPLSATLLLLTVGTFAWHTVLGLQVVIEDYVGSRGLRLALLIGMKFAFVLAAAAAAIAVLRLAFGAPA
jgi:succinate dehydrogenase / fumarate reductase, membrane anchor subunit